MTNEVRVISYIIGSDSDYYNLHHFTTFSVPTADTLFLLILSILALESAHSIRFLYQHFLSRITEKSLNVFLCVDDTMVSKFGTKFENVSKLFDHTAHNGSNYLNGHCFVVSCSACPFGMGIRYLIFPFRSVIACGRKKNL